MPSEAVVLAPLLARGMLASSQSLRQRREKNQSRKKRYKAGPTECLWVVALKESLSSDGAPKELKLQAREDSGDPHLFNASKESRLSAVA